MAAKRKIEHRIEIVDVTDVTTIAGMIELEADATLEGPDGEELPGKIHLRFSLDSAGNAAARLQSQLNLAKSQIRR